MPKTKTKRQSEATAKERQEEIDDYLLEKHTNEEALQQELEKETKI